MSSHVMYPSRGMFEQVFCCRLANGAEFLFQAKDDEEMAQWTSRVAVQCDLEGSGGPSRSQTLPASGDRKDEPKRRSFFTLKKKLQNSILARSLKMKDLNVAFLKKELYMFWSVFSAVPTSWAVTPSISSATSWKQVTHWLDVQSPRHIYDKWKYTRPSNDSTLRLHDTGTLTNSACPGAGRNIDSLLSDAVIVKPALQPMSFRYVRVDQHDGRLRHRHRTATAKLVDATGLDGNHWLISVVKLFCLAPPQGQRHLKSSKLLTIT
uniref:PH domain-containing protein n=1 Tax=Timema poppense TaxID=170557 RepID=A0A7R9H5E9_TIMPO|nr:unnamed protein product [Timema poppensis]